MVVHLSMLGGFGRQVKKEYVCKVNILVGNLCKIFFGYQASYLKSTERVDLCIERDEAQRRGRAKRCDRAKGYDKVQRRGRAERYSRAEVCNMNYKSLMLQVKHYSYKLFLPYQLDVSND